MSQLTVDIVARVNDTLKKLGATEAQIRDVNDALKATQPAAKASTSALNDVAAASAKAGTAARGSSQKFFQFGQAVSDFSVAGIRGAANNLEVLALQMGIGGPLLLAIAAATSAFVVFGDDIAKALDPIGTKAAEVETALRDVLDVIENEDPDLLIFEEQIPQAIEEVRKELRLLQEQIRGGTTNDLITFGTALAKVFNFPDQIAAKGTSLIDGALGTSEQVKTAGQLEGALQRVLKTQEEISAETEAEAAARGISVVALNELQAETIRLDIERLGLGKELEGITDKALLKAEREGKLQELIAKLYEKRAKATREEVSELDKARKSVKELADELTRRRAGQLAELDTLRDQAKALQQQLKFEKEITAFRTQRAEAEATLTGAGVNPRSPVGISPTQQTNPEDALQLMQRLLGTKTLTRRDGQYVIDVFVAPRAVPTLPDDFIAQQAGIRKQFEDLYSAGLNKLLKPDVERNGTSGFSDDRLNAIDGIISGLDRTQEAFDQAGIKAQDFYLRTREGFADLASASEQTAGNFASAFAAAYDATDGKQRAFFVAYKAFAIAEATIATYNAATQALKAGPILGPILAAGIVAAGLGNVARIASTNPGGGSGGGGRGSYGSAGVAGGGNLAGGTNDSDRNTPIGSGYERLPNGAVVPARSAPAFQPLAPSPAVVVNFEGELVGEGETLRAIVRNTDKRVQSTRGVAQ